MKYSGATFQASQPISAAMSVRFPIQVYIEILFFLATQRCTVSSLCYEDHLSQRLQQAIVSFLELLP